MKNKVYNAINLKFSGYFFIWDEPLFWEIFILQKWILFVLQFSYNLLFDTKILCMVIL